VGYYLCVWRTIYFRPWIPTFFELKQLRKDNTLLWMEHYIVDDLLAVGLHETIRRDLLAAHREVKEKAGGPNGRA